MYLCNFKSKDIDTSAIKWGGKKKKRTPEAQTDILPAKHSSRKNPTFPGWTLAQFESCVHPKQIAVTELGTGRRMYSINTPLWWEGREQAVKANHKAMSPHMRNRFYVLTEEAVRPLAGWPTTVAEFNENKV